jgi:hypothetical protein
MLTHDHSVCNYKTILVLNRQAGMISAHDSSVFQTSAEIKQLLNRTIAVIQIRPAVLPAAERHPLRLLTLLLTVTPFLTGRVPTEPMADEI